VSFCLAHNVFGLAEGGEFLAQMFNLAQMFFRSTMLKKALMPHFWQTHVGGSFFSFNQCRFFFIPIASISAFLSLP
jgi:hypothetical protein